ncbi:PepSY domain-containing protein [uncultured Fluviicola sp.]|uniref:PepSY domain-containing protein n=1 Tax=uncultured Fluviicola sp. TaxID=463303 RepID=UPI0025E1FE85|nr:PepSY domain-containing protein [uncultured Fluviicola sp.]
MNNSKLSMRVLHRYLGFFLAGIMAVYAISGIVLIFRDTDFLKSEHTEEIRIEPNVKNESIGKALDLRRYNFEREEGEMVYFRNGDYNKRTGVAHITTKELPYILDKMTHLHKASTDDPLYWLNVFFGVSLLFFVLSAFWMYLPKTKVFKAGLLYSLAGLVLTLILLFV